MRNGLDPGLGLVTPTLQLPYPSRTLSQVREQPIGWFHGFLLSHSYSSSLHFTPASRLGLFDGKVALLRLRSNVVS